MLNGSAPAEQNHSSVVAHLGKGANWGVAEHISHMLKRQIHLTKARREKENSRFVQTHRFKSKLGMDDETAKKSLSKFAYEELFTKEFRKCKKLEHLNQDDGSINVWPCGKPMESENLVVIQAGRRCSCFQRMAFDHQCCHEMCSEGGFDIERFGHRWLNEKTFQQLNPTLWMKDHLPACSTKVNIDEEVDSLDGSDYNQGFDPPSDEEEAADMTEKENRAAILELASNLDADSDTDNELDSHPLTKLSYQSVMQQFEVLARLVQTDRNSIATVSKMIQTVTERARSGLSIDAHFDTSLGPPVSNKNAPRTPVNGTLRATTNVYEHNRLISRFERRRNHIHSNRKSVTSRTGARARQPRTPATNVPIGMLTSNDGDHLAPGRTNKQCCSLCKQAGHTKPKCPRTMCYKSPPLKYGEKACRLKLSSNLGVPNIFPTSFRPVGDRRVISTSLPNHLTGCVIHERRFIRNDLQNNNTTSNMCLECTFLGDFALPLPDFQKQLYGLSSIQSYINRSKSNVVICEFDYDESAAMSAPVAGPPLSQLSQMSQFSQMSQYSVNPLTQYAANPIDLGAYNFDTYGMPYGPPKAEVPIGFGFGAIGPNM